MLTESFLIALLGAIVGVAMAYWAVDLLVRVTSTPFRLDGHPLGPRGPAPYRIGEHTRGVLEGLLGYPAARIDELLALGTAHAP